MSLGAKRSNMGLDFGLQESTSCLKQRNRWLFQIDGISATTNALPPLKANRPHFEFKEQQVSHLVQKIYYPIAPEWKPINLTLFDLKKNQNPVFEWISLVYDPSGQKGREWNPIVRQSTSGNTTAAALSALDATTPTGSVSQVFKRNATLSLYNGCGDVIEQWRYENCNPISVNWGELDMNTAEIITVEINLRYDRAYLLSS